MKENYYTTSLEEIIYHGDINDTKDNIRKEINNFINELIKRKRNDPFEGGLQASMVLLKDSFAGKVNEEDGIAPHAREHTNLIRFLNGKNSYLTSAASGNFNLSKDEAIELIKEGIEVRVLDGEEELMFAISSQNDNQTSFQFQIIKELIDTLKEVKEENIYKSINVGLATNSIKINIEDLESSHYQEITEILNNNLKEEENTKSI